MKVIALAPPALGGVNAWSRTRPPLIPAFARDGKLRSMTMGVNRGPLSSVGLAIDHNSPTAGTPWLPRISAAPFAADMNSHVAFGP